MTAKLTAIWGIAYGVALLLVFLAWRGVYAGAVEQPRERLRRLEARVQALEERWLLDQYLREAPLAGREAR